MKNSKYQNIFNYYRGQNLYKNSDETETDYQIEDNTTKALINTLEKSTNEVVKKFLHEFGISTDKQAIYELQPTLSYSRPDAVISIGNQNIYIESKVAANLDIEQIKNHIKGFESRDDIILVITLKNEDENCLLQFNNVKFLTWNEIWKCFSNIRPNDRVSEFLINEFLNYLEDNNMTEFNIWKQKDFNAFLFIEEDKDKERRRNVKGKFSSFMEKIHGQILKDGFYPNTKINMQTKIEENTFYIWGNFVEKGIKNSINIAHFLLRISALGISLGINIEGVIPTRRFEKKLDGASSEFTEICNQLDGYSLILSKRWQKQVQIYDNKELAEIHLGKNYNETDTQYLISKISQHDLFEINIEKLINRDAEILKSSVFEEECINELKTLRKIYYFCIS
ncbi:MAG: hypothetical protein K8R86_12510 [Bacteroidales bacterium]|nr:hypothetical protein [Bacteroidales bacterium]